MKRLARTLVLSACLVGTGCFGSFPLVRAVHGFNSRVGGPVVRSVVFWAFLIVPIYEVAVLADFWVFNVIEFWTGGAPIAERETGPGGEFEASLVAPDVLRLRRVVGGEEVAAVELVRVGEGAGLLRRADGTVLATSRLLPDGRLVLTRAGEQRVLAAGEVESLDRAARDGALAERLRASRVGSGAANASTGRDGKGRDSTGP